MSTFLISGLSFQKSYVERHKNGHILLILAPNEKNKTTFFFSTLKVWEKKGVLVFHFELKWLELWPYLCFSTWFQKRKTRNQESGHILLILAPNEKIRPPYSRPSPLTCFFSIGKTLSVSTWQVRHESATRPLPHVPGHPHMSTYRWLQVDSGS